VHTCGINLRITSLEITVPGRNTLIYPVPQASRLLAALQSVASSEWINQRAHWLRNYRRFEPPLAHAQFVSNIVDYHMNVQAALEEARFMVNAKLGCNIVIEARVTPEVPRQLKDMGQCSKFTKSIQPRWDADRRCFMTAPRRLTMERLTRADGTA
jgi:hypothetical protein